MTEHATLPRGTKPKGASSEQEASRKVREMFTRIAPRYDLLNHLLSAQMDRVWRSRTASELKPILDRSDAVALDLCCGTGDLAFALRQHAKARVVGADFSHTMLVRAREKALGTNGTATVEFFEADALRLPFADQAFDLVTTAFGFRNLANYEAGLREIANPSELFLSERDLGSPGTAVFAGIEGSRPLLVEMQALVAPTTLGTPRRAVVGWDQSRLSMVLAVLEAHCGVKLSGYDVYLNVAGGWNPAQGVLLPNGDPIVTIKDLFRFAGVLR